MTPPKEWSASDIAMIREIARVIVHEAIPDALNAHVNACTWGQYIRRAMWIAAGVCVGSGVAGGGVALAVVKAIGG